MALLGEERPDAVLLNLKLVDGLAMPVVEALNAAGIPFGLISGLDETELLGPLASVPRLAKPFGSAAIEHMLRDLLHRHAGA